MKSAKLLLVFALFCGCQPHATESVAPIRQGEGTLSAPSDARGAANERAVEIAVTVDDLPIHGPAPVTDRMAIAERFLAAFRRHRVPSVYGFVNGKKVVETPSSEAILLRWREAGHPLGNHTYSHVSLNAVSLSEYFGDLEKGEEILKKLEPDAGVWKVFRYPFLFEGDTLEKREGVRRYLREHGYTMAPVTIDADDWAFNAPLTRCTLQKNDAELAKLHRWFVDNHVDELRRMRELSQTLVERPIRHILLLHIGVAEADALEDLLTAYEKAGARWIDLRTALADPIYSLDAGDVARFGAAFPYRLAKARGIRPGTPIYARDLEGDLARTCPDEAPDAAPRAEPR